MTRLLRLAVIAGLVMVGHLVAAQTRTVRVSIPDYQVTRTAGLDQVEIPGGQMLETEPGRPRVPFYTEMVEYPAGCRIQDVKLTSRGGAKTDSALHLSVLGDDTTAIDPKDATPGVYPQQEFAWNQVREAQKTTLLLHVFPFRYDPRATTVEFHGEYVFDVRHVQSGVAISDVGLEPPACDPGQEMTAWVGLENLGQPIDIVLSGAVMRGSAAVADLADQRIQGLGPVDTAKVELATSGLAPGDYLFRTAVKDRDGNELDRVEEPFRLGIPRGEISRFEVTPGHFTIGDDIGIVLEFRNTGSITLDGRCVIRIARDGQLVEELAQEMSGLRPGGVRTFRQTWSTRDAQKSAIYQATGVVKYEGTACEPRSATFSTNLMPAAGFTVAPETASVGDTVEFVASSAQDPDGRIVEYRWEFDDGGTAQGASARHAYQQPGSYAVGLTVVDNEGGTAGATRVVTVSSDEEPR
jgi:plastocyanin